MRRATWFPVIVVAAVVAAGMWAAGGAPVRAQGGASPPCTLAPDKTAAPAALPLGYGTRVELRLRVTCPMTDVVPVHIMLVLDGSGSMAGEKNVGMKTAAKQFVRDLDLPNHPLVRVAVVKYNAAATTLCKLTDDVGRLVSCIGKIDANGGSGPDQGLAVGYHELAAGRPGPGRPLREIIVLVTDGGPPAGCQAMVSLADPIKADDVELVTVGMGLDTDHACLQRLASGPDAYFRAETVADLAPAFDAVRAMAHSRGINRLTVIDDLPTNMRLLPWTAAPAPAVAQDKHLEWRWRFTSTGEFVMSYWVTPQNRGNHPVNVLARASLVDDIDRTVTVDFPVPQVQVLDNAGVPSPTPWPSPASTAVPGQPQVCPNLAKCVPAAVIADALANPQKVGGWLAPCSPSLPPGPANPPRMRLSLQQVSKPYHPLFNGLVYKCGCP